MKTGVLICSFLLFSVSWGILGSQTDYTAYVDPFIGTGGHGHTFPGATVPFGMVQLSPDTRVDESWDGCSGYHHSDSLIYGFSHTHLSGTGCSDYGDIMLMPVMGKGLFLNKAYAAHFSHNNEKANPGFYSVKLAEPDIDVALTSTTRVGLHKYTFNKEGNAAIILDLLHRDKLLEGYIKVLDDKTIEGSRRSQAWAKDQLLYYRVEFSKPFADKEILSGDNYDLTGSFNFNVKKGESIFVKVSISPVSTEGAHKNMEAEIPHWDFEKVKKDAEALWNKELSKIEVTTTDRNKLKIFYTALYHTMIQPNVNMDVDGQYRGMDRKVHKAEGFTYYSVFSLWDTFRAAHPLYTIIDRKRSNDFIRTFLAQYEQGGRLPMWELASNETDCMIGYHSVSVINDAYTKGIRNFDSEKALEAMKKSATWNHYGIPQYIDHGYLSMDDEHESVSKTLEYAYDDWCIAQFAKQLNKTDDYANYMQRSQSWKNVFDPETGFMRARKNGGWFSPFAPQEVNNNYTEGNSWQYSFFVPQDIQGMIKFYGGPAKLEQKLDELFTTSSQTTGREQADITGLIGQYAQGNEPSHHMAYLYNYIGKPEKSGIYLDKILNELYKPAPDGLSGNEDCGQMSAWYVLSAIGIYQVTPGTTSFQIGMPQFDLVKIKLENGKTFTLKTTFPKGNAVAGRYIADAKLNGKAVQETFIDYTSLMNGETLDVYISNPKGPRWSAKLKPAVLSTSPTENIVRVPIIQAEAKVFRDLTQISLLSYDSAATIYYATYQGDYKDLRFEKYEKPFTITTSRTILAYALLPDGRKSFKSRADVYRIPNNWSIQIHSKYNRQYTAGGDEGLIDGINGTLNWRKGDWQGYQGQDFEAVIDLKTQKKISEFSASCLQDTRAWILMPKKVEYYWSSDGKVFHGPVEATTKVADNNLDVQVEAFNAEALPNTTARYVKVKAINYGKLPAWHAGAGGDAFIFIDEIGVK